MKTGIWQRPKKNNALGSLSSEHGFTSVILDSEWFTMKLYLPVVI